MIKVTRLAILEDIKKQNRNAIIGVAISLVLLTLLGLFLSSLQIPKHIKHKVVNHSETSEKWIEEDGESIGGTYVLNQGYDFTSFKTGRRYIGGKNRGDWTCLKTIP